MTRPLRIYVGWDEREAVAFHVFAHSLIRHASKPIQIIPLVQSQLRATGSYTRAADTRAATSFSLTRFLVPLLSGYRGISIFADCDMLCTADIWAVLDERHNPHAAVWCCQHDYVPKAATKMDGQKQEAYPRKNWSSFMVFNNAMCEYRLTKEYVNGAMPADLHRLVWAGEDYIGSLPLDWNHLVGEYEPNTSARNLHFTNGGPWFPETRDCDHAELWLSELAHLHGREPILSTMFAGMFAPDGRI